MFVNNIHYLIPLKGGVDTADYTAIEELRGTFYPLEMTLDNQLEWNGTHPRHHDTDGDGIYDAWEFYTRLNPHSASDGPVEKESLTDGLVNYEEFHAAVTPPGGLTNHVNYAAPGYFVPGWFNKRFPTDPNDPDTDWDQLADGDGGLLHIWQGERPRFNLGEALPTPTAGWAPFLIVENGGLCPTTIDTDEDQLPDAWEGTYGGIGSNALVRAYQQLDTNGVMGWVTTTTYVPEINGTVWDQDGDPDGDGLENYQEYMIGAVYHWQFQYNNGETGWTNGLGVAGYDAYDFFDPELSDNGEWFMGPGGRAPYPWDPYYMFPHALPVWLFSFLTGTEGPAPLPGVTIEVGANNGPWYSTANPMEHDTDSDGMDDYWEVFHGLNPLFGIFDIVRSKQVQGFVSASSTRAWDEHNQTAGWPPDFRARPWLAGYLLSDSDQDQLSDVDESLQSISLDQARPPYHHTDPSPLWFTDISYSNSWVNLYYQVSPMMAEYWWWGDVSAVAWMAPSYVYSFEMNEGFDTDNDFIADRAELVSDPSVSLGVTDPLNSLTPPKRRALYLNGTAAARTMPQFIHRADELHRFTVECWARAENPAAGSEQVIIERVALIPQGHFQLTNAAVLANFRIGLDPDGRPFVGYNGQASPQIFQQAKASAAGALLANRWYHLAGTYDGELRTDGTWTGMLRLLVDGKEAASLPTSERPINGWVIGLDSGGDISWGYAFGSPVVIGAADNNPEGWIDGHTLIVGPGAGSSKSGPALNRFFRGWVDQARIWTVGRSEAEIQEHMSRRYTRQEVTELAVPYWIGGAGLLYCYTFDDLPDPDHSDVFPKGFDGLDGRPTDYSGSPFWATADDRSRVYDDYRFIPWIENLAAHIPLETPRDQGSDLSPALPDDMDDFFPNTANPYGMAYRTFFNYGGEFHPFEDLPGGIDSLLTQLDIVPHYPDLLPLWWAAADEDVPMWDGAGYGYEQYDSDGDGLPDWWEMQYGLDYLSTEGDFGADGDPDGDGISNDWEYRLGLDPRYRYSLDPNGYVDDGRQDSDGDGIVNLHELTIYMTDPSDADTDDDGYGDGEELTAAWKPTDSSIPYVDRALTFTGGNATDNVVTVRDEIDNVVTERHSADEWTIECWVSPGANANGIYPIVSRRVPATNRRNYEIGISNGVPYAAFDGSENGVAVGCVWNVPLQTNTWTHLAARFEFGGDFDQNVLSLFVNGALAASARTGWRSAAGPGDVLLGSEGFVGQIRNVRLWKIPQSDAQIAGIMRDELLGGDVDGGVLSLTGNGHLKENAATVLDNGYTIDMLDENWTLECWIRTTDKDGGLIIARRNQANTTDTDFNYALTLAPNGALLGRFGIEYVVAHNDGTYDLQMDMGINNMLGEIVVNDGKWHHVAYVRDDTTCRLYVDGICDVSQPRLFVPFISEPIVAAWVRSMEGPVVLGEDIAGSLDECRIWNRALDQDALVEVSSHNLLGDENGLISYFNFDFQLQSTADERSYLRDPSSEYGIYIDEATRSLEAGAPISYDPLFTVQRIALLGVFLCNDGGEYVEDRVWRIGLPPFDNEKYAGQMGAATMWAPQSPTFWINGQDTDGDGLLDAWERNNGLDPFDADSDDNGVSDLYDDWDRDGLSNHAEYLAGTNPWVFDSDGDGISDYEDTSAGSARMNGVRWTDNDYVEDYWEAQYDENFSSPSYYDEHYDRDGDGWNNWSEARVATPTRPDMERGPTVTGGVGAVEFPLPNLIVKAAYNGFRDLSQVMPTLVVHAYTDPYMNGMPDAVYAMPLGIPYQWPLTVTLTANDLTMGHLRQGTNWFHAFLDLDGSQRQTIDPSVTWFTWTAGEPAAVADGQIPGNDIGWDRNELSFVFTDEARSYARLSWDSLLPNGDSAPHTIAMYHAVGGQLVFSRIFHAPRTWLHEGDIMAAKAQQFGLAWGVANGVSVYRWTLDGIDRGFITNSYSTTLPAPLTVYPKNSVLRGARPEFAFRMAPEATDFDFELRRGSTGGTVVYSGRQLAPTRRAVGTTTNDLCLWRFPYQAGSVLPSGQAFTNGVYYWRVRGYSPAANAGSAYSDQPSFSIAVNASPTNNGGMGWFAVHIRYPGLTAISNGAPVRVQAFNSRSFNGIAAAEVQMSTTGTVTLAGLTPGEYYVRAYVDQNNNRQRDSWESYGYLRDQNSAVKPFRVVGIQASALGQTPAATITIRDADSDNDLIPDALEYIMHGAGGGDWLAVAGPGPITSSPGYSDFDGDGLNDLSELDAGTSIFVADSDGDGIGDLLDRNLGLNPMGAEYLTIAAVASGDSDLSLVWRFGRLTSDGSVERLGGSLGIVQLELPVTYVVEHTASLTEPDWQPITNVVTRDTSGIVTVTPVQGSASGFFRVRMFAE
ncbi:MAG: hypothetical protein PHR35_13540 [Kiritimatiellae bacterium]|nr:hypothetical protein [Kiritimatiellia bacterium]